MRSFMRSYVSATEWNTPATRSSFSFSVTVSHPKCVVFSLEAGDRRDGVLERQRRVEGALWFGVEADD
jgi:hypothetical protein